jgi:hypothetical protein
MTRLQASMYAGAMIALRRLRGRAALAIAASAVAFATIAAVAERRVLPPDAASRALQGPVFGLAIPLAVLALVTTALGRARVDDAMNPAALLGASRRMAAVGALVGVSIVAAVLGLMTAGCGALAAHGPTSPAAWSDALTAGWIGASAGVVYTIVFLAASSFGSRGGLRAVVLVVDLVLGPIASPVATLLPRAHELNLLGASGVAPGFSQPASCVALVALSLISGAILLRRVRP